MLVLTGSGCHAATPDARTDPPTTTRTAPPVDAKSGAALPTKAFHLPADGVLPAGCLAWSARKSAAACTVGAVGTNMDHGAWSVVFLGDYGSESVDLAAHTRFADGARFSPTDPLPVGTQTLLVAKLEEGNYVALEPLRRRVEAGAPLAWGGAEILWKRESTFAGGENQAPRYTDTLTIRWDSESPPVTIESREDAPVASPEYAAYLIPGNRYAVMSDVAAYGDEGLYGTKAGAWLCDRLAKRCD